MKGSPKKTVEEKIEDVQTNDGTPQWFKEGREIFYSILLVICLIAGPIALICQFDVDKRHADIEDKLDLICDHLNISIDKMVSKEHWVLTDNSKVNFISGNIILSSK